MSNPQPAMGMRELVEFKLKLPRTGNNVWIPCELVDTFGRDFRVVAAGMAAVLYSASADTHDVISSAQILIKELELKAAREAKQNHAHS
jgi:hypothetical protein